MEWQRRRGRKRGRESRHIPTSAEESGPCQQLPPSRKKKWQLPWLDGAYETIIPPPYLVLYVWTSSVRARRAGRVASTLGRGGERRGRKEEARGRRDKDARKSEREGREREERRETDSVEKRDVGRGETTWVSSDDYDDDYDDDEDDDDEDDGGDDHHRLTEKERERASPVDTRARLYVSSAPGWQFRSDMGAREREGRDERRRRGRTTR